MGFDLLATTTIGFAGLSAVLVLWYLVRRPLLTRATKIVLLFDWESMP